ncbi:hypothetical protein [Galbitalea soli]|uniref:hypothetical protein n=1 Tax=Galbitalea soli TaxID=1268042 RepID=UPI0018017292|nr:hypothetical protein [Galbitalea soli]NYJ30684.1 hypothetical protein [Galbitalea soli]
MLDAPEKVITPCTRLVPHTFISDVAPAQFGVAEEAGQMIAPLHDDASAEAGATNPIADPASTAAMVVRMTVRLAPRRAREKNVVIPVFIVAPRL